MLVRIAINFDGTTAGSSLKASLQVNLHVEVGIEWRRLAYMAGLQNEYTRIQGPHAL